LQLLGVNPEAILIESTGVIGQRIKKVQCYYPEKHFCEIIEKLYQERSGPFWSFNDAFEVLLTWHF
jgi:N-acetylglutamate synthase/N-acetylornithine aminotransferase